LNRKPRATGVAKRVWPPQAKAAGNRA